MRPPFAHTAKRHLVYFKRPDAILFVDALPKSASGKIISHQLP